MNAHDKLSDFKLRPAIQAILLLVALMAVPILTPSCKSPPEVVAYKTIGTQVIAVESAKKALADAYVAGQVSEKDFQQARVICDRYDAAVKVERDAVLSYKTGTDTNGLNRAMIAVTAASADLMAFTLQVLPPANAAKLKGL